jgi:hypothetical protein
MIVVVKKRILLKIYCFFSIKLIIIKILSIPEKCISHHCSPLMEKSPGGKYTQAILITNIKKKRDRQYKVKIKGCLRISSSCPGKREYSKKQRIPSDSLSIPIKRGLSKTPLRPNSINRKSKRKIGSSEKR